MPRSARKESGYGIYHVMMRGINRQAIFDDDEESPAGNNCTYYASCLMSNHFHLLIRECRERFVRLLNT